LCAITQGKRNLMKVIESPYKKLLNELELKLKEVFGDNLVSLVLYGSVARGDFRKDSDIDLLIIFENLPKEKLLRQKLFIGVEKDISFDELYKKDYQTIFSPILKTSEEAKFLSPLYLDMVDDAIVLYDKNSFFQNVLARLKSRLKELGAVKKKIDDKWYWDLKANYKFGEDIVLE